MPTDKSCFVICPIGDEGSPTREWSDLTFDYIIKPVVKKFGYKPIRADHIKESGMITTQIIEQLIESPLVIADLTNSNPNVFYELAIRHIAQKPYIQMIKVNQKIPFDITGMRTIFFDVDLRQADNAKIELQEQIESIEKGNFKASNPITHAHNYSMIQSLLQSEAPMKDDGISRLILSSIEEMSSSINDLKKEISKIKYGKSKAIGFEADANQDKIEIEKERIQKELWELNLLSGEIFANPEDKLKVYQHIDFLQERLRDLEQKRREKFTHQPELF